MPNPEFAGILLIGDGVEIKMGSNEEESAARNLLKFKKSVDTAKMGEPSFLAIVTATQIAYQRDDGVWVIPLGCLKD